MTPKQEAIISHLSETVYIIEEQMVSKKEYLEWVEEIYDMVKAGFEIKEFRTFPVTFKFKYDDTEVYQLELRHFLTNIMIWEAFVRLDMQSQLDASFIYDATNTTDDTLYGYFNTKILDNAKIILRHDKKMTRKMNRMMHDITYNLSRISMDFNMILGISINMRSFIDLAKRNERFNEIINTKLPEDMQPAEIESFLDALMKEEIEILRTEDNCLRPMIEAHTGIKDKQLREFSINGGTKPDLYGNTIPIPINTNFLVGGLNTLENYAIDAMGGRKAAIMSKSMMGISGHFATTVVLVASSVKFSHVDDCGSIYPVPLHIRNISMLYKFVGRYYKEDLHDNEYKIIRKADQHLIGKLIYLRSPMTCACKDGICKTCYGKLYEINKDLESPGAFSAIKLTMPVSQDILSSKHLLSTTSTKIEFNEEFHKFFKISSNYVIINDDIEDKLKDYTLVIKDEDLIPISEYDENEFNHFVREFYIKDKNGEMTFIEEINKNDLYIDKDVFSHMKKSHGCREINLAKVRSDKMFVIEIKNNELTKPLYDIMDLLDKKKNEYRTNIPNTIIRMNELMIESKINLQSVHAEMILSALIRRKDNILERPDFSSYGANNYDIITVKDALENHPSPIIGISFQYLKRQLTKRPLTYMKGSDSVYDPLFREY